MSRRSYFAETTRGEGGVARVAVRATPRELDLESLERLDPPIE